MHLHTYIADSPEDLGVQFIEMFIKKQSNIELLLSTLEVLIYLHIYVCAIL